MDGTKNWGTLTEVHGMLTMQQMRQDFLGSGPGSSNVLLPGNRNQEHKPPPLSGELPTSFLRFQHTSHLHV